MKKSKIDKAFEQLYDEYAGYVQAYCNYKLKDYPDYVQDCVQDTFRVLYENLKEDVEIQYPKAFLLKTASNFVKLKFREIDKQKKTVSTDDENITLAYEEYFDDDIEQETILRIKNEILAELSDDERELLEETCKSNKDVYMTTRQLAQKYNCSENAIRQRIFILRAKIKKCIKEKTKHL